MPGTSPAVLTLLIVNVAVFLVGFLVPGLGSRLVEIGAFWFTRNENFAVWQAATYMFLHGDISHLAFNMIGLLSFGVRLEHRWGSGRFLLFYALCGVGAALIHNAVNLREFLQLEHQLLATGLSPEALTILLTTGQGFIPSVPGLQSHLAEAYQIYGVPMIGASGAVYGILVAFGLMYPNAKLLLLFFPAPISAKYLIPIVLGLDLFSEVTGFSLFGRGIAHIAHLGGAAIGLLLTLMWRRRGGAAVAAASSPFV
jgi:membrane associated rhomboid family serine protease